MDEGELVWLARQAEMHIRIVEVGVFCGRSCRALADNTRGSVTAVDAWEDTTFGIGNTTGVFEAFANNMFGLTNLRAIKMSSLDAAKSLEGELFDMVFIDADHRYEAVKADIQAWLPRIVWGGLICGYDYNDKDYGVTQAVNELLPGVVAVAGGCIWAKVVN